MRLSRRIGSARCIGFLVLLTSVGVAGCGASTGKVSGKVYYKNTPLKGGNVSFVTADQQTYLGEIQEDGSYTIGEVPPGDITISVETQSLLPPNPMALKSKPLETEGSADFKPPDYAARAKRYVAIPERYTDPEQSGLKYTIKGGSQEHDIKLE